MSFEKSIDQLVYHSGNPPRCTRSRVHETWHIEQDVPLLPDWKKEFSEKDNEPVENWIKWLTIANKPPKASLKVVVIRTEPITTIGDDDELIQNAERLKDMFEAVNLPIAGLAAYLKNLAQYACIPSAASAKIGSCSFFFSDPSVAWTWSYCPDTQSTRAILLCRDTVDTEIVKRQEDCRVILEQQKDFVDQPMLLSYLCTEAMGSRACSLIGDIIIPELLQIERSTGLQTWNPGREEILDADKSRPKDSLGLGVVLFSQRLTDICFRLDVLLDYIPIVRRQNKRHADFLRDKGAERDSALGESLKRTLRLDEVMECFHDYLKVRKRKAESLASRINAQVVAVEKLQAEDRARESHAIAKQSTIIAEESKSLAKDSQLLAKEATRDSKGMMTIAAVTMVFLPGTFVSALFAMPIFQWDASNGERVVNPRIWVYWIVTVPLTFLVLGLWAAYRWWIDRKETREDKQIAERTYRGKTFVRLRRLSSNNRVI